MTPKARKKHLVALKQILTNAGFKQDAYGNFKYPDVDVFRVKFKANNLRVEKKMMGKWLSLESKVWSQLSLDYFTKAVESVKKRVIKELGGKPIETKKVTKTTEGVPLCPALSNPAKVKQMETVLEKRNHQDYQCYMILQEMMDIGMIMQVGPDAPADMQDMAGLYERAQTAISNRISINDKFMRLMAGAE